MKIDPKYEDVTREVKEYLAERTRAARRGGIPLNASHRPGIGYAKSPSTTHAAQAVGEFRDWSPVLVGPSASVSSPPHQANAVPNVAGTVAASAPACWRRGVRTRP